MYVEGEINSPFFIGIFMEHWDQYWLNRKTLTSFANSEFNVGYGGELASFWCETFAKLGHKSVILDLGCGNGALSLLALRSNKAASVLAVDLAAINPCQLFSRDEKILVELNNISFYPKCNMESLPLSDNAIDLVVSQFGFEYSNMSLTLRELNRVIRTNGKAFFLCHHVDSEVSLSCTAGVKVLNDLLKPSFLIDQLIEYAMLFSQMTPNTHEAKITYNRDLVTAFKKYAAGLNSAQTNFFNEVIRPFISLMSNQSNLNPDEFRYLKEQLAFELNRIHDQVNSTLDNESISKLKKLAIASGFEPTIEVFKINGKPFAWLVELSQRQ